jgi:hypothetical protein
VFSVRCTFSEQNDGRENEVQANVNDDRKPDQGSEALREIEHKNVGADAQFHQCHAVEIEELSEPQIIHVLFQIPRLFEDGIVNVSAATDFGHLVAAYCAGDGKNLVHVSVAA